MIDETFNKSIIGSLTIFPKIHRFHEVLLTVKESEILKISF